LNTCWVLLKMKFNFDSIYTNKMDIETRFEKAIIQGNLNLVRELIYTGQVQVNKRHLKIAQTLKELCQSNRTNSIYDQIIHVLILEYKSPPPKLNWLQRLIGINVDFVFQTQK
jgi:hypothetical protein